MRVSKFADEWRRLEGTQPWLRELGFRLIDSRGPEGMNQGFHVYAGERVAVRIIADRDQWFVEVRPDPHGADASGWKDWFTLEAWSECLGAPVLFHVESGDWPDRLANSWWLAPQLDYLRANLGAIEVASAAERLTATRSRLLAAQRHQSAFPAGDQGPSESRTPSAR